MSRPTEHERERVEPADGEPAVYAREVAEPTQGEGPGTPGDGLLYRELVENVNSAVLRWDRHGVLTFMNQYALELFGWRPEEVIGGPVTVLVPSHRPGESDLSHLDREVLEAPEDYATNVNENVTKDGRRLWMAWTNRALRDASGEVLEILAIGNDITELVRAQTALRESEERYRTIVELADEDLSVSSDGTYSFRESVADDGRARRRRFRATLVTVAAWARRHPLRVLLMAVAFELAFLVPMGLSSASRYILGLPGSLLALTVVVTAALTGWQIGLAAAIAGGLIFWGTIAGFGAESTLVTTVVSTGIWIAAALIAGLLTNALRDQARLRRSAAVALARAETLHEHETERAAQAERARIARDLHDSVTQSLFAATLRAEALTAASAGQATSIAVSAEEVHRLNRGALAQMRTMLLELRGDPVDEVPLPQLLRNLVEAAESRAGVEVSLTLDETSSPPPEVHQAVYRITQEALNNVVRHARAKNAWVKLESDSSDVRLVIGDDGCAFDPASVDPSHLGLKLMREYACDSDGRLVLTSHRDKGTVVCVEWRTGAPAALKAQRPGGHRSATRVGRTRSRGTGPRGQR